MTNFMVYMVGVVLVVGALAYGAYALGVAPIWIGIGVAVLLGMGLMGAAKRAGIGRDNPNNSKGRVNDGGPQNTGHANNGQQNTGQPNQASQNQTNQNQPPR